MGIPTFFISILKNKKYKNIHKGVNNPNCDYFFIDFNSIIYGSYQIIKKKLENRNYTKDEIEDLIINEVILYTRHLIADVVKPKYLTYIAMDGPCPKSKIHQQRSRRYKGYKDKLIFNEMKAKYSIPIDLNEWDVLVHLS